MADVKIVDIDGSQWSMKDEVARNKIAELEKKEIIKITNKINKQDFIMNLVEINNEKFLQLHFMGLRWSGIIGDTVATFVNDFGLLNVFRCLIGMDFQDGTGRDTVGLDIEPRGVINAYPQTVNQITGMYRPGLIYGDAFVKVTC